MASLSPPRRPGHSLRGPGKPRAETITLQAGGLCKPAVLFFFLSSSREGKGWGNAQTYIKSRLGCGSDGLGERLWSLEGLQTPSGWEAADN